MSMLLHPATMRSISLTPPAADDKPYWPSKQCGCHVRGDEWLLCSYHEGYEDGIEAAMSALSIGENTNTAAGYYGDTDNPNKAGDDQ